MRLRPIKQNGLVGYADADGTIVIPCQWRSARSFTGGQAAVEVSSGFFRHIDRQGNLAPNSFFRRLLHRLFSPS